MTRQRRAMSHRSIAEPQRYVIALVLGLALVALGATSPSFAAAPARIAVYRTTTGEWFILDPVNGPRLEHWGCAGCGSHFPLPRDYDGDGVDDIAVAIVSAAAADPEGPPNVRFVPEGIAEGRLSCATCALVPHDYDGDRKAEFGVYDAATGQWGIRKADPSSQGQEVRVAFGCPSCGDVPVPARFADLSGSPPLFSKFATPEKPAGITTGPDGNLWLTEFFGNRIGRMTTAGGLTQFPVSATTGPLRITTGPDGNLWFTGSNGNRLGRITPAGVVTEFPLPTPASAPHGITAGPDGNLWFTERAGNRVGFITPAGVITEFPLPHAGSGPTGITTGPDGNLWFTESGGNRIGRITPAGVVTEFPIAIGGVPSDITAAPDGNLWFTNFNDSPRIGRITPTGDIQQFVVSASPFVGSSSLTVGPDGKLWVKGSWRGSSIPEFDIIWRVDLSGQVELEFKPGSRANSVGDGITAGPDGRIWFSSDQVGSLSVTLPYASIAVYRTTTGEWFIRQPDATTGVVIWGCPACGDVPVPRDYDGDGIDDIAVFRPATAEWFIRRSSDGGLTHVQWGAASGDLPVPRDYDGDGKADIAVYRTATGEWFIRRSSDGVSTHVQWGCGPCGDVPVPANY